MKNNFLHESCEVHPSSKFGSDNKFWHQVQIMQNVVIGNNCVLGKGVFVGANSVIGSKVKIGNYSSIFGSIIQDDVFIGPYVALIEDQLPRSTNLDGSLRTINECTVLPVRLEKGCSIGVKACILPGIVVGEYAFIAAGSIVFDDVPAYSFAIGNPARVLGYVCKCGRRINKLLNKCPKCNLEYEIKDEKLIFTSL
jgi:UDP-2-acetamido-3-amino-2,3-dideoxy-glucuronate N-acetyltransferase